MTAPFNFATIHEHVSKSVVNATRITNQLVNEDVEFQRSVNPESGQKLDAQSARLLSLSQRLLRSATSNSSVRVPAIHNAEDLDIKWRSVLDSLDVVLERADFSLDEFTGMIKRGDAIDPNNQAKPPKKKRPNPWQLERKFRTQDMPKPQRQFREKLDNFDESPFRPLLTSKPHALTKLQDSLLTFANEDGQIQFLHPYKAEIEQLVYPDFLFKVAEPIKPSEIDAKPVTFVKTPEDLTSLLETLKKATEIAVDLEHHDVHSYVGIVSLMQISTREQDWIVDTLVPWRRDLQILNEVFADPKILKVFHGAFMDIVWLQRDLGLYVVGLFDTYHACRRLGFAQASLAFLLEKYTDFEPDKKFQMADWRIRPLPSEMLHYARADTHFLLFIYDNLRNELIQRSEKSEQNENHLQDVLENSKETSLSRYERYIYDEATGLGAGGWYQLVIKSPGLLKKEEFRILREVHIWRENLARKLDESPSYLLHKQQMQNLARTPPKDMDGLRAMLKPPVKETMTRLSDLWGVIRKARKTAENDPDVLEFLKNIRPDHARDQSAIQWAQAERDKKNREKDGKGEKSKKTTPGEMKVYIDPSTPVRTPTSQFWGPTFSASADLSLSTVKLMENIRLAVPLPPLTAQIFKTEMSEEDEEEDSVDDDDDEDVEDGGVRLPQESDPNHNSTTAAPLRARDEISFVVDVSGSSAEGGTKSSTARRSGGNSKQRRKAARANARSDENQKPGRGEEEEAFDYSKAASVLHGNGGLASSSGGGGGSATTPWKPYAKSGDAPKGLGRARREKAGKSHTFRS